MKSVQIVRMLRNNPRYFCKYLVLTNIFILLYFVISSETVLENSVLSNQNSVTSDQSEKLALNRTDSDDKPFKFSNFDLNTWSESQRFKLKDSSSDQHFITLGKHECYKLGSDDKMSSPVKGCVCRRGYHGPHCGIPTSAWQSYYKDNSHKGALAKLKPRKQPRRLIHGLQVNHETDLFEARLEMLDTVVDVYLVLESNYSSYGTAKPLTFIDKFRSGWLASFQQKLLYVFLPYFPKEGETNGWYADSFLRMYLGTTQI